jgi:hypothetical protein
MIAATNQLGHEVQRHDGRRGWQAVTDPFATRDIARDHMRDMPKEAGAEYRVYAALIHPTITQETP